MICFLSQMSPNMRVLLCEGVMIWYHWICLIESFQMSTNMRGLLCVRVMIWVPSDLSHGKLSNESQYEGSIV